MNLSALSQQLDLIKKENLDMLKRGYVPDPDISWINEIVDRTNEQLVSLQDFYNDSSKTHEALTSEHLNEVRCLYETWQSAHLKNINKRAEAAKTTAQVTKLNNLLRELYSSSTPDITSHFDIERVKREGLDAETEANQIIQTLVRPLVQDLADIKVRQQFYDHIDRIRVQECSILKNRLHKVCMQLLDSIILKYR